jgi:hypothetical protein
VDCYIDSDDIWWQPEEPELGDKVWIFAQVHCGDQFSKPVPCVLVRAYLGDPGGGTQIGRDSYALDLEPGSVDTTYFYFDTQECEGIGPCEIYVIVDPDENLDEYDENNNAASKEMTFSP